MGQVLIREILETDDLELAGATEAPGHEVIGADLGKLVGRDPIGVTVTDDPLELVTHIEGVVDFTTPQASLEMSTSTAQARIVHVIGTTGFSPAQEETLKIAARHATIIKSGNLSLGVNLLAALTEQAAASLGAAGTLRCWTCTTATRLMRRPVLLSSSGKRLQKDAGLILPTNATRAGMA